jgi:uncharacterized protein YjbI with pentapeptide repeats
MIELGILLGIVSNALYDISKIGAKQIGTSEIIDMIRKKWRLNKLKFEGNEYLNVSKSKIRRLDFLGKMYKKIDAYEAQINEVDGREAEVFILDCSYGCIDTLNLSQAVIVILDLHNSHISKVIAENATILHFDASKSNINELNIKNAKIFNLDKSEATICKELRSKETVVIFEDISNMVSFP